MKKACHYTQIIGELTKLKTLYPKYNMGRHLSTIIDDCNSLWGMPDKELLSLLQEYMKQAAIDKHPHMDDDDEIKKIIDDGMHLERILFDEPLDDDSD